LANKKANLLRYISLSLRTCTVSCCDLKGVEHAIEVTADSLYEAVAQGLRAFRENDWVDDIGGGLTTITVVYSIGPFVKRFRGLDHESCPFQNLPESEKGRRGEGLTAEDMSKCRWLAPRFVGAIEFAEWTSTNHLRHSKFIALRDDKDAKQVRREVAVEA
jgi:hypothetical protein